MMQSFYLNLSQLCIDSLMSTDNTDIVVASVTVNSMSALKEMTVVAHSWRAVAAMALPVMVNYY